LATPLNGRILVIRGGALGDFVLTLPVLSALKRQFPGAQVEWLGYPQFAAIAIQAGLADSVRPIDSRPMSGFFARNGPLDDGLAEFFGRFHVIFSYLYDPDEIFRDNLKRVTKAQVIQGPHRPNESSPQHAAEQLLVPLEKLGIFDADPTPRIHAGDGSPTESFLAVHPGSGSESKNWPEAAWADFLARWTVDPNRTVLLIGGEAEGSRLDRLAAVVPPRQLQMARSLPLDILGQRLARGVGFIGHDSGISHLAAAHGLPGLVLWGPTEALVWRPRSDRVELLMAHPSLWELSVSNVLARLEPLWARWIGSGL
jgi:heptosyltransferase III